MGTKEMLYKTRTLGWGADTRLYSTFAEFREQFAESIASGAPRVVKQNRGNGGIGVWKVTLVDADAGVVRVQHAAPRDDVTEDLELGVFIARCASYFESSGKLIDQPFAERLAEGMIRAYFVTDEVVGFARQSPASPNKAMRRCLRTSWVYRQPRRCSAHRSLPLRTCGRAWKPSGCRV